MAELERQSTSDDPIATLHRMSTTAGVATSDYVAINNLAITALVLGVATVLAIVAWLPLMVLGVAGVICGFMAIRQVNHSNGTQGGRGLAVLGIALSVLLAGTAAYQSWAGEAVLRPDKQAINQTIERFGQAMVQRDYAAAYALFDPDFQRGTDATRPVSFQEFETSFKPLQEQEQETGSIVAVTGNNMFEFVVLADGTRLARTKAVFRFSKSSGEPRVTFDMRRQPDGTWKILGMPEVIDQRPQRPRQPQPDVR